MFTNFDLFILSGRNHIFTILRQPVKGFWFCQGSNFAISRRKAAWSPLTRCCCAARDYTKLDKTRTSLALRLSIMTLSTRVISATAKFLVCLILDGYFAVCCWESSSSRRLILLEGKLRVLRHRRKVKEHRTVDEEHVLPRLSEISEASGFLRAEWRLLEVRMSINTRGGTRTPVDIWTGTVIDTMNEWRINEYTTRYDAILCVQRAVKSWRVAS